MAFACAALLGSAAIGSSAAAADVEHVLIARPSIAGVVHLPLIIDGRRREVPVRLWPHSIRAATFAVDGGERSGPAKRAASRTPPPARTLRGAALDGSGVRFAGSLLDDGLHGIAFLPDGARVEIAPEPGLARGGFDVVALRPVEPGATPGACAMDDPGAAEGGVAGDVAPPVNRTCIAELACDADYEYFAHWGSVEAVVDQIELVTNVMNLQYEHDVGLTHQLTMILVRTVPGEPYTATTHTGLLTQFRNEWNINQSTVLRDVAELFTGKDLVGAVVGFAYDFGQICQVENAYCLVQSDYDGTLACSTDLSAHELGHLWDAHHCICVAPPSTMNSVLLCANTFQSSPTPGEIIPFAETLSCLECVPVDCNGNGIGDADDIAAGTSDDCNANNVPDECDLAAGHTDCDGNGTLDVCDTGGSATADCNGNGLPDACDIAGGTSTDLDHNGVPDECDPDCNGNGLADGFDIQQGTSSDCDANAVPDECQIAGDPGLDCNANGVLDACELASLPTQDCNGNGVLDICDIAAGTSQDLDGNAVPDECDPDCNGNGVIDGVDILQGTSGDCNLDHVPDECQWQDGVSPPGVVNADAAAEAMEDLTPTLAAADATGDGLVGAWRRTGGAFGADGEIVVARSADRGRTWSSPQPVTPNPNGNIGGDLGARIVTLVPASAGQPATLGVIWSTTAKLDGVGVSQFREIQLVRSTDGGLSWSAPSYVHPAALADAAADQTPDMAADGTGRVLAVWQSKSLPGTGSDGDIALGRSLDGGATWSFPVTIQSNAATDALEDVEPRIAFGGNGRWLVAWQSKNPLPGSTGSDFDIHASLSVDDGLTWSPVVALNPNAATDGTRVDAEVAVEGDGDGGFAVLWSSQGAIGASLTDRDIVVRRSFDGVSWLPATVLSGDDALEQGTGDLVRHVEEGATVWRAVWRTTGVVGAPFGSDTDLFLATSLDGGVTWGAPVAPLLDASTDGARLDDRPTLVAGGATVRVAYESNGPGPGGAGGGGDREIRTLELWSADCNANGVADWCEIAGGQAADRNGDGVPDRCASPLTGDLDGDGAVGPIDLAILLGAWGQAGGAADLDGDGAVGASDLAILLGAWTAAG